MWQLPAIGMVLAACAQPQGRAWSLDSRELSSANRRCGYNAIQTPQRTAQGDHVMFWLPCWDETKTGPRYQVPRDRDTSARLARVEATHCKSLYPATLVRSPFAQRGVVDEIVPHRIGSTIQGVHVVLKPVPGLTVSWMRRAIACHQARWTALGRPADYLAGDPTLVADAHVEVSAAGAGIAVRIATASEHDAQIIVARARALLPPPVAVVRTAPQAPIVGRARVY